MLSNFSCEKKEARSCCTGESPLLRLRSTALTHLLEDYAVIPAVHGFRLLRIHCIIANIARLSSIHNGSRSSIILPKATQIPPSYVFQIIKMSHNTDIPNIIEPPVVTDQNHTQDNRSRERRIEAIVRGTFQTMAQGMIQRVSGKFRVSTI